MRIFGKEYVTKKELKEKMAALQCEMKELRVMFPFVIGQTVYDIQLRNANGKYAKKNISFEHSIINEVIVSEKNYFGLVKRYQKNDVFANKIDAETFIRHMAMISKGNNISK